MSFTEFKETLNGPFVLPKGDMWIRYGIEHNDLVRGVDVWNNLLKILKALRPQYKHVIDGGSNLGSFSVPLAKVNPDLEFHAFEVQRLIYYGTCGTIALQGLMNIKSHLKGLGNNIGSVNIPVPDYSLQGNFGAYEVKKPFRNSDAGSWHWVNTPEMDTIDIVTIDSLGLEPLMIKLDVEGMEVNVLQGASSTIDMYQPIIWCERHKSDTLAVENFFANKGYTVHLDKDQHWFFIPSYLKNNPEIWEALNNQRPEGLA